MTNKEDRLIEARPEQILVIDQADRTEWPLDYYKDALNTCSEVKGYAQWVTAKLCNEVLTKKLEEATWLSKVIGLKEQAIYNYKHTYSEIIKRYPEFEADGFFPWSVVQLVVREQKRLEDEGVDGSLEELFKELRDAGANTIPSATTVVKKKEIKAKGQVVEQKPGRPQIPFTWNEETRKYEIEVLMKEWQKVDVAKLLRDLHSASLT